MLFRKENFSIHFLMLVLFFALTSCHPAKKLNTDAVSKLDETEQSSKVDQLADRLRAIPGISIKAIKFDSNYFKEAYEVFIEQPLDHFNPEKGTFKQKFYLNHRSEKDPMIFNINGYSVPSNSFVSELVPWLNGNQIHVEHRFFDQSVPDPRDYDYLTIEQAANDHHRIIKLLKQIYTGKWLSTGISKGGQATIFHRSFFPDDVDVSIPYVAPVNLAVEDERLLSFLDEVGESSCRTRILAYQRALLMDYDNALKLFSKKADKMNLVFPMGYAKAFELSILEYEFAYWQWSGGAQCDVIPVNAKTEVLIEELYKIDAPGFFTEPSIKFFFPFFYQAYAELGMYGYATDSLEGYLKEYDDYVNNYYTFIPEDMKVEYNPEPLKKVHEFLNNNGNQFIYVYGENDAWSATAYVADPTKTDAITVVKENGSHFTRIKDLDAKQKDLVFKKLEKWLEMEINLE